MINASLADIAHQIGVPTQYPNIVFEGISSDTRTLHPGNLYVAIPGAQFDGHQFVEGAIEKKAAALLVNRQMDISFPQLVVNDTVQALGNIAKYWRNQFSLPLVGVTGSNGKTTVKNMIAAILSAACRDDASKFLATKGNFNNHIGLPMNLIRLNSQHKYAVLEMGMNHPGEITYLSQIAKPTIALITNAAPAHLEGVQSVLGVAQAKGEIFSGLKTNGVAILNRDDEYFHYWHGLIGKRNCITFGLQSSADITASIIEQGFILETLEGDIQIRLSLLGTHNVMNALAAAAAAIALNIELDDIKMGLENVKPAPGRMCQHVLVNGVTIIDDTYNANPNSLQAAVNTLANYGGIKIMVLGDMKELGKDAKKHHFAAGQNIKTAGIDYLFTLGDLAATATEGFGPRAQHFTEYDSLLTALTPYLHGNATVLIKGSRSMQMEKIVARLI